MARLAFDNHAAVSLNCLCRQVVVGFTAGPDGVGAAVAGFAGDPLVPLAVAVQDVRLFGKPFVGGGDKDWRAGTARVGNTPDDLIPDIAYGITGVTGFAPGQIGPGLSIGTPHRNHVSVAVDAFETGRLHGTSGAFCGLTRMAVKTDIAAGWHRRYSGCMETVGRCGHILVSELRTGGACPAEVQRRRIVAAGAQDWLAVDQIRSGTVVVQDQDVFLVLDC